MVIIINAQLPKELGIPYTREEKWI